MSVEIIDVTDGLLTVKVTGTLTKPDLERLQASAVGVIQQHGKVRILVIATNFLGWDRQGDWGDVSFQAKHDKDIEKIAIVGDQRWQEMALAFSGKGYRRVAIEYFVPADLAKAREWVSARP